MEILTEDEAIRGALRAFTLASLEVALDCTPGSSDDVARDFGLAIEQECDFDDVTTRSKAKAVRLEDGRVYVVRIVVVPGEWPTAKTH